MIQRGRIVGEVDYREGDGPNIRIRPGPCQIEQTSVDATISWTDGDARGSAAMPIDAFRRHLASGAIRIDGDVSVPPASS